MLASIVTIDSPHTVHGIASEPWIGFAIRGEHAERETPVGLVFVGLEPAYVLAPPEAPLAQAVPPRVQTFRAAAPGEGKPDHFATWKYARSTKTQTHLLRRQPYASMARARRLTEFTAESKPGHGRSPSSEARTRPSSGFENWICNSKP